MCVHRTHEKMQCITKTKTRNPDMTSILAQTAPPLNGFKVRSCRRTVVPRRCAPPRRRLMPPVAPVLLPLSPLRPVTALDRSHGETTTRPLPRAPTRRAAVTHSAPVPLLPPCRRAGPTSALYRHAVESDATNAPAA